MAPFLTRKIFLAARTELEVLALDPVAGGADWSSALSPAVAWLLLSVFGFAIPEAQVLDDWLMHGAHTCSIEEARIT